jgi:hypothetical protein
LITKPNRHNGLSKKTDKNGGRYYHTGNQIGGNQHGFVQPALIILQARHPAEKHTIAQFSHDGDGLCHDVIASFIHRRPAQLFSLINTRQTFRKIWNKHDIHLRCKIIQCIKQGLSGPEFQIALRNTDAYQKRFAGNTERIKKGLTALSPGEYLALEDQYQNIMRNYGLPADYYTKDSLGVQQGFNKLIANDVSAVELEERVLTAQKRVLDAAPEVKTALKQFYPDITNGDILAYTLDPEKGLEDIKKKVTAAEIGGAALVSGLTTSLTDAEYLRRYGVTKEKAQEGYKAIGAGLERGSQLANIYQQEPYIQATAEEEVFNLPGQAEASKKRKRIIGLEEAAFSGQTGVTSGALGRERAGSF